MLGVVIGRFQTPYLHEGHQDLINYAKSKCDKLLILIGVSDAVGTDREPMDFETRKGLFLNNDIVLPLKDMPCDIDWSKQVDKIINDLGFEKAIIFGGKDNSICDYYKGEHEINIMIAKSDKNATDLRRSVKVKSSQDFREGIIYHTQKRYPIVYSTVDIVIVNNKNEFLVGKKGNRFAFIGGFVDPQDKTLVDSAKRELLEESGINIDLKYKESIKINDYRYNKSKDSIMTHVFTGVYNELPNNTNIKDFEFKEFKFFNYDQLRNEIQDYHKPILQLYEILEKIQS
jgi:bifunctional NMN adenylyltransferase/nudix hydrolase